MSALARLPVDGLALLAAGGGDGFPAAAGGFSGKGVANSEGGGCTTGGFAYGTDLTSPRAVLLNPIKLGADGTAGDLHCCKYG